MYKIVILTDSNRNFLEVLAADSDDLSCLMHNLPQANHPACSLRRRLNRVVYEETFASGTIAAKRLQELQHYTRMQRERLIRRQNPNWLNRYPVLPVATSGSLAS